MRNSVLKIKSKQDNIIHVCEIHEKDAWSICDFAVANEDRLKDFFPKTLAQNLNPELAQIFIQLKTKQFREKEEYLFVLKEEEEKKIIGLVYIKELLKLKGQGEFAYCIDYNFEGHGIITQVVTKLADYAFNFLKLDRLQIIVHKSNTASINVAENCNFLWKQTLIKSFKPTNREAMDMELYERFN